MAGDIGRAGPGDVLRVDPEVMQATRDALAAAAQHLQAGLRELDAEVLEMLAQWTGSAGASFAHGWHQWHAGASKVQSALATLAAFIGHAGGVYDTHDQTSAQELGSVRGG